MSKRNRGFILLTTLCAILVMSTLLLTCLHHILLYHKALNVQERQHQNFYQLEYIAKQLTYSANAMINKSCVETRDMANEVILWLIKGQGCSLTVGQAQYRYIIEDLGDFPCLILYHQQQKYATRHLRVSVLSVGNGEYGSSLLQLRFVKPAITYGCFGEEHQIKEGVSSWRYLSTVSVHANQSKK